MIAVIKPVSSFEQLITRLLMWSPERRVKFRYSQADIKRCLLRTATEESSFADRHQLRNGAVYSTNCHSLSTSVAEMKMVSAMNPVCTKPAWNILLAWAETESVDDDHTFWLIDKFIAEFGMSEHQRVSATFRKSGRVYSRVVVNRVHPDTGRVVNLYNDALRLNRLVREYNAGATA
ncbi:relaxase/mobilization nuclease domain-containing protein [Klebsiella aerogenes]